MEQTITIQPIINDKVSPSLAQELFEELNFQLQIDATWALKVDGEFAPRFKANNKEVSINFPTNDHEDHQARLKAIMAKDKIKNRNNYIRMGLLLID